MSFGYDPEVPAGFQDADIEMAELTAAANNATCDAMGCENPAEDEAPLEWEGGDKWLCSGCLGEVEAALAELGG